MSSKVHHNTAKKAKKYGVELAFVIDGFTASKDGTQLAVNASASVALEQALAKLGADPAARVEKVTKAIRKAAGGLENQECLARETKAHKQRMAAKARKPRDEDEESEDGDEGEEEAQGASIIKPKYKTKYRPFKMTCGDDLAQQVSAHIKFKDEDRKMRVDARKLKAFAEANECWQPGYANLNVGMRRLNVVNRLRAKVRHGHAVVWG